MLFLYLILTCTILPICYGKKSIDPSQSSRTKRLNGYDNEWIDPHDIFSDSSQSTQTERLNGYGGEWIDPHHILFNDHQSTRARWVAEEVSKSKYKNSCANTICMAHYRRLLNILLRIATEKTTDELAYKGKLFIEIPIEDYNILKEFASSVGEVDMLQQMDSILTKVLLTTSSRTSNSIEDDSLPSWSDYMHIKFYNANTFICLSCLFVLLLSYKLLKANLTLGRVFKYLLFLGWIVDFSFRWISLLQEAEINNMVAMKKFESVPADCNPKNLSIWTYIATFFHSSQNCKEYHHVLHKDHFYSVSPLVVFSHQIGIIIHTPASNMGQALGSFTSGILQHLPWGVNVILLPLLLIFVAIIICISLTFFTNTSFGINIMGIFKFNFGNSNSHRGAAQDMISGDNLSTLINNLTQRNMVEDVRPTAHICSIINSEECTCSEREVETNQAGKLESIELTTNILETTNEGKIADETKENVVHDGSGDSK